LRLISGILASPPRFPSAVRLASVAPYAVIHLFLLAIPFVGASWAAVGVCLALFFGRMFVITAFYHRYFSHRSFSTHRVTQFVFAFLGTTCAQRGPIWWAAHHRDHHRHSEDEHDLHSPHRHGLLWSHMGWFNSDAGLETNWKAVPDWAQFRELVWLERLHLVGPVVLAVAMYLLGWGLERAGVGTSGWQMLVWGFGVSTVLLYHGTFTINSIAHVVGRRRFATKDDSRNNFWLALLTLGEGWHNNHHFYPGSARQGFYWWEVDLCYYGLWLMQKAGLVWGLRPVPKRVYEAAREHRERIERESPGGGRERPPWVPPVERG